MARLHEALHAQRRQADRRRDSDRAQVTKRPARAAGIACLCLALASLALAQRGGGFGGGRFRGRSRQEILPNAPYDGRFTFVRVNYESTPDGYWYGGQPAWAHGYPVAEENLMKIMNEVSYLGAHDEAINSLRFDDPELFKYPIAYVIEPDWWAITDSEIAALRTYMLKAGSWTSRPTIRCFIPSSRSRQPSSTTSHRRTSGARASRSSAACTKTTTPRSG